MLACCMSGLRGPVASEVGSRVGGGEVVLYCAVLVGGLSRGVRGGQTSGLSGVVCHTYLLATQLTSSMTCMCMSVCVYVGQ